MTATLTNQEIKEEFEALLAATPVWKPKKTEEIAAKTLPDRLSQIQGKKLKAFQRQKELAAVIVDHMSSLGDFIRTADGRYFFFDYSTKNLTTIAEKSEETGRLLYKIAKLNGHQTDYRYIVNELVNHTALNGKKTEVYQYCRFQCNKLYVSTFNGRMLVLDGDDITESDNGADGVLFLDHQDWQPWEFTRDKTNFGLADIVNQINFDDDIIDSTEYRMLFIAYVFGLFFRDLTTGAVIAAFLGEKGSGKTTLARILGRALFGDLFEVRSLSDKEDAFFAMIASNHFLTLDNLDGSVGWFCDYLAAIATGTCIVKRELYTTNQEYKIWPRVFIAITSRTPAFKRDDVADRLLIFRLKRFDKFIPERIILDQISQNRNALMSEIVRDVNTVVREINKNANISQHLESDFRMADFAILGERIWSALGGEDGVEAFRDVIRKMATAQHAFTVEDDVVPEMLVEWVDGNPANLGVTAADLFADLKKIADEKGCPLPLKSARSLGRQLGMLAGPMREFYGIKITHYDRSSRSRFWVLTREQKLILDNESDESEIL